MENQHSIKTILSFGAKSVEPQLLEQLLVGRDKNAEYLFKSVEGIVNNGNNQQILVVGQRGMGKTHLIRVLYHRCQPFINKKQLIVAYFSEEEYGVASYFDFLTRILYAFIRWNDKDKASLQTKLEELQDTTTSEQTYFLEKIIKDYISKKPLLILAENFGDILESMGPEEQGKFRAWMYNNDRVSIIATNQSLSEDFDREDRPFYGFFNLYYLKTLSYKESLAFLISLAKLDNKPEVVKHLKTKGKAQVKAIHQLVKGNHRLLVTFYEFLKTDTLVKLSNHFIKTINDLKPYYETYIRYLPPQQQKIIRYIALTRKPQQGTTISKNCFIDPKSLSKQLNELVKKNLIEALLNQTDKRNKLYDINEPLLRISIEVGEHKEGITALFIDFLAVYYDENELEKKKLKFTDLIEKCDSNTEKKFFQYEIQAIEKALKQKTENSANNESWARLIPKIAEAKVFNKQFAILKKHQSTLTEHEISYISYLIYAENHQYQNAIDALSNLNLSFIKKNALFTKWGYCLLQLAIKENKKVLYIECIKKCEAAVLNNETSEGLYNTWGNALAKLARIKKDESLYIQSFDKFNKAIELNPKDTKQYAQLGYFQTILSIISTNEKWLPKALKNFKKALSLNENNHLALSYWGCCIDLLEPKFAIDHLEINTFKSEFCKLSINSRTNIWKVFKVASSLKFFKEVLAILKSDFQSNSQDLVSVLIEWITYILADNKATIQKEDLNLLRETAVELQKSTPELSITLHLINTYEEYILYKNKNILYELPKEQRLFFQKYILGETSEA